MENNHSDENQKNTSWNATLEDDEPKMSEEEIRDSILEDSDMSGFQKWIARLSDAKWKLYQRILGVILGLGAGVALFWDVISGAANSTDTESKTFSYPLIVAVVIALLVPNIIERKSGRKLNETRVAMVIALGTVMVAYLIYGFASGSFGK